LSLLLICFWSSWIHLVASLLCCLSSSKIALGSCLQSSRVRLLQPERISTLLSRLLDPLIDLLLLMVVEDLGRCPRPPSIVVRHRVHRIQVAAPSTGSRSRPPSKSWPRA
jgi:hypothetical protein